MKTEKNIYIKYDQCLFSKSHLYFILTASSLLMLFVLALYFYQIVTAPHTYIILSINAFPVILSAYRLSTDSSPHFISINDNEITFKQNKLEEEICLRFELIEYFETHFSKIIFSTKDQEKIILQLDKIKNEQKRWEIKEFLRGRVKQIKAGNFAIG